MKKTNDEDEDEEKVDEKDEEKEKRWKLNEIKGREKRNDELKRETHNTLNDHREICGIFVWGSWILVVNVRRDTSSYRLSLLNNKRTSWTFQLTFYIGNVPPFMCEWYLERLESD